MTSADGPSVFGADADEPYARALEDEARALLLQEVPADLGEAPPIEHLLDVARFLRPADAVDEAAIRGLPGPLLDVGCGPGRMVEAAAAQGRAALGIDVSPVAVALARRRGARVLRRSVFDALPCEGGWGAAILLDGNIGIGGDPAALLRRCADLIRPGDGRIVVETHAGPFHDHLFQGLVVDDLGRRSLPFPWAEVGAVALRRYATSAGLLEERGWTDAGRTFAEFRHR